MHDETNLGVYMHFSVTKGVRMLFWTILGSKQYWRLLNTKSIATTIFIRRRHWTILCNFHRGIFILLGSMVIKWRNFRVILELGY